MNTIKNELFDKADQNRAAIQSRMIDANRQQSALEQFRTLLAYTSIALDGGSLSEAETDEVLRNQTAIAGKPLSDHNKALGHSRAFEYLLECEKYGTTELNEELICHIHLLYYAGVDIERAGVYKVAQNRIADTEYTPPSPKVTPMLMKTYINDMNQQSGTYHPVEFATILHKRLLDIHPFSTGNGCTARLLMNLILRTNGYGFCIIPPAYRDDYMAAIREAQEKTETQPLVQLIARCLLETQKISARLLGISL